MQVLYLEPLLLSLPLAVTPQSQSWRGTCSSTWRRCGPLACWFYARLLVLRWPTCWFYAFLLYDTLGVQVYESWWITAAGLALLLPPLLYAVLSRLAR